jgi:hypothetical protein
MADVVKVAEDIVPSGLAATYFSPTTTDQFLVDNDGKIYLHFKKSGAGACNVTIVTPGSVDGLAIADRVVSVPATTGDRFIGPFPRDVYNNGVGQLAFTCSEITGLTCAVLRAK